MAGDQSGEAGALYLIGVVYLQSGAARQAQEQFEAAAALPKGAANSDAKADLMLGLAMTYSQLGEREKALDSCQNALQIFQAVHNRAAEAAALATMGDVYFDAHDDRRAAEHFE